MGLHCCASHTICPSLPSAVGKAIPIYPAAVLVSANLRAPFACFVQCNVTTEPSTAFMQSYVTPDVISRVLLAQPEGVAVGAFVGAVVGTIVGGATVGAAVAGADVGAAVGGATVGAIVVGARVGAIVAGAGVGGATVVPTAG